MGWQSQSQSQFGTGPISTRGTVAQNIQPGTPVPGAASQFGGVGAFGGTSTLRAQPQAQNPYDLGAAFNAYYGGQPTHQVVSAMQSGQNPAPGAATTASVASPTASPAQAGQMNAQFPGIFNGNPANGVPSAEDGFTAPPRGGPGMAPPSGQAPPMQPPTPAPAPAPKPDVPPQAPPPPTTYQTPSNFTSGGATPMPTGAANANTAGDAREAAAPGPAVPTKSAEQTYQIGYGGQQWTTTKPKPANWANMSNADRMSWVQKNSGTTTVAPGPTEYNPTPGTVDGTVTPPPGGNVTVDQNGNVVPPQDTSGSSGPPSGPSAPVTQGATTSAYGNWTAQPGTDNLAGKGPGLYNDAGYTTRDGTGFKYWANIKDLTDFNSTAGDGYKDMSALLAKRPDLFAGRDFYTVGLGMSPEAANNLMPLPAPGAWQYTGGEVFSGLEIPTHVFLDGIGNAGATDLLTNTYKYAQNMQTAIQNGDLAGARDFGDKIRISEALLSRYGVQYNPTPGDAASGTPAGEFPGQWNPDANLPAAGSVGRVGTNLSPDIQRIYGIDANSPTSARATAYEAQMAQWAANVGLENQRRAALQYTGGLDQMQNDPRRAQAEGIATDIGNNPDPTDWETVRNKTVADSDANLQANLAAASGSFNRRGIGAAGAAGIVGDAYRGQANDVSSRLGDLSVQQSEALRRGQLQALDALGTTYERYTGGDVRQQQGLASVLMGQPPVPSNPASGVASSTIGLQQLSESGQATGPSPGQGALSGAVAGAGAGMAAGPWGALIGAVIGGGAGYYNARQAQG